MRVIIADDEPLARERLKRALACIPEVEICAVATSGLEARTLIEQLSPDVAMLDIEMPGLNGVAVVDSLLGHRPEIIYLTAYQDHAVKAFSQGATDYLTKPLDFERLREAIRRAQTRLTAKASDERFRSLQARLAEFDNVSAAQYDNEAWVRIGENLQKVGFDEVDYFAARKDYVELHLSGRTYLIRNTLTAVEGRLDPRRFARCHRSIVVNLARVRSVRRRSVRALSLTLTGGQVIAVGPNHVPRMSELLKIRSRE